MVKKIQDFNSSSSIKFLSSIEEEKRMNGILKKERRAKEEIRLINDSLKLTRKTNPAKLNFILIKETF